MATERTTLLIRCSREEAEKIREMAKREAPDGEWVRGARGLPAYCQVEQLQKVLENPKPSSRPRRRPKKPSTRH